MGSKGREWHASCSISSFCFFFVEKKKQVRELQKSGSSQYHPVLEKRCTLVAADPIFPKRSSRRVAKIPIKIIIFLTRSHASMIC